MSQFILHKNGAYNVFCTIVDAPIFDRALTLEELCEWYRDEYGRHGMEDLPGRLERAHANGTSSRIHNSLEECVSCNRAGPRYECITYDSFIRKYLTLLEPAH